jgi:hypothetical protein
VEGAVAAAAAAGTCGSGRSEAGWGRRAVETWSGPVVPLTRVTLN